MAVPRHGQTLPDVTGRVPGVGSIIRDENAMPIAACVAGGTLAQSTKLSWYVVRGAYSPWCLQSPGARERTGSRWKADWEQTASRGVEARSVPKSLELGGVGPPDS